MASEVETLRRALERISLAERDTTTAAADKVRDMARIAREALRYPYNAARIAWELERTAMGDGFHGNALRVAKDIPGLTDADRTLLDRYATGRNSGTDHVALQDLALRIDRTHGVMAGRCPHPCEHECVEANAGRRRCVGNCVVDDAAGVTEVQR